MAPHRLALLFLVPTVLAATACASGSAVVTGSTRPPVSPKQVKLYLEPPATFEVIGLVNASSDAGWSDQGSMDYAIKELRKQAGKLGANGVLLVASGETTTGFINGKHYAIPITAKTLQGKAIFVTQE